MSPYRVPAFLGLGGAPLFDYAAEAARKERLARRARFAVGAALGLLLAVHVWTAGFEAVILPWLPVVLLVAWASCVLALTYWMLERPS